MSGPPGGEHRERGRRRRPIPRGLHRWAIERDEGPGGRGATACVQGSKHSCKRWGGGRAKPRPQVACAGLPGGQARQVWSPARGLVPPRFHRLQAVPARQERAQSHAKESEEVGVRGPLQAWGLSGAARLDQRRAHGIRPGLGASAQGSWWEQPRIAGLQR